MSKKYHVQLPIAGVMYVAVDAGSRREAIDLAVKKAEDALGSPDAMQHIECLDVYERFFEGNISQVELDEVSVEDEDGFEVDEDDEEETEGLEDEDLTDGEGDDDS